MNKNIIIILTIGLLSFGSIITFDYALAVDCYDRFIFAWHTLNPVLQCLDSDSGNSDYQLLCSKSITASNATSLSCDSFIAKKHLYVVSEIKSVGGITTSILFSDDYTTNTGWTQIGTLVTVDSAVADKVDFADATGGSDRRVHKSLGITLPNDIWTAEFDFIRDEDANSATWIWGVTAGTSDQASSSEDGILIYFDDNANCDTTGRVYLWLRDGASASTSGCTSPLTGDINTPYYVRLERTSTTSITLSVFTDSSRTTHVTNSPHTVTISSNIVGLTHIQHSVISSSSSSFKFDGTLDNTVISAPTTVGLRPSIRFNNDNSTNYVYSNSLNLNAYNTVTNTNDCNLLHGIDMANNDGGIFDMLIYNNIATDRKLGFGEGMYGITTNDAITPNDVKYKCKWDNINAQITTVNLISDTVGLFNQNSTITIWGYD